jgi:hypothetical protein
MQEPDCWIWTFVVEIHHTQLEENMANCGTSIDLFHCVVLFYIVWTKNCISCLCHVWILAHSSFPLSSAPTFRLLLYARCADHPSEIALNQLKIPFLSDPLICEVFFKTRQELCQSLREWKAIQSRVQASKAGQAQLEKQERKEEAPPHIGGAATWAREQQRGLRVGNLCRHPEDRVPSHTSFKSR